MTHCSQALGWGSTREADSFIFIDHIINTPHFLDDENPSLTSGISLLKNVLIISRNETVFQGFLCGMYQFEDFNLSIQIYFRSKNDYPCTGKAVARHFDSHEDFHYY